MAKPSALHALLRRKEATEALGEVGGGSRARAAPANARDGARPHQHAFGCGPKAAIAVAQITESEPGNCGA